MGTDELFELSFSDVVVLEEDEQQNDPQDPGETD